MTASDDFREWADAEQAGRTEHKTATCVLCQGEAERSEITLADGRRYARILRNDCTCDWVTETK